MEIGAVSLGWGNVPLSQILNELSQLGGQCVEINGRPGRHDGLILSEKTGPQVQAWAEAAGLTITGISGYSDFAQTEPAAIEAEIERLLDSCRVAAGMGLSLVRAFVGEPKPDLGKLTYEDFRPQIIEAFQAACRAAAELGITLAIENHGRLVNDGPTLVGLLADVGAPNLGVTLDTGNFCGASRTLAEYEQDLAMVLPYVVNVHIKDGLFTPNERRQLKLMPAGQGELGLDQLISRLVEIGYDGPILSEYEGEDDFAESTRLSLAYLKETYAQAVGQT
jgi:sugar phosphate isomerase/epimerase